MRQPREWESRVGEREGRVGRVVVEESCEVRENGRRNVVAGLHGFGDRK